VFELSQLLNLSISSTAFHIKALEDAKLIRIEYKPALKGHKKLCSIEMIRASIHFCTEINEDETNEITIDMPVGAYYDCNISKGYMANETDFIFREDDFNHFLFTPERFTAQLFSFQSGYVIYRFPNLLKKNPDYNRLSFSFECCSEAPFYNTDWPSDITVWINDLEIATFHSPGDFGGVRGTYTPKYWQINSTQFGLLKKFSIDESGCYLDNSITNKHVISDLQAENKDFIELKIGFKENATYVGGINIFGKGFGNYPQNILMSLSKNSNV
jgi:predicted transcriptional regulator